MMRTGRKKKRTWLKVTGIFLLLFLSAGGVYAYAVYHSLKDTVEIMHQPIEREIVVKREEPLVLTKREPFSVLMLGVDERAGDKGRSDSIVVLTVNPNQHSVKMLSIPRDTRTEIAGTGKMDKINHAYAFGDIPMAMETVEKFLDIPIDYYIKVNMKGFEDFVNAVGGITVHNSFYFMHNGNRFSQGKINLNGKQALSYARMRYDDPRGDIGREHRQRQVIQAILHKGASITSLSNYNNIFQAVGKNVKTNLTFNELTDIQQNYKDATQNIQQLQLKGTGMTMNHIFYIVVPPAEKKRVQTILKSHLELVEPPSSSPLS